MTRKDYELIARAIDKASGRVVERYAINPDKDYPIITADLTIGEVIDALADALAQDNPRFDRERFVAACLGDANELGIGGD